MEELANLKSHSPGTSVLQTNIKQQVGHVNERKQEIEELKGMIELFVPAPEIKAKLDKFFLAKQPN